MHNAMTTINNEVARFPLPNASTNCPTKLWYLNTLENPETAPIILKVPVEIAMSMPPSSYQPRYLL